MIKIKYLLIIILLNQFVISQNMRFDTLAYAKEYHQERLALFNSQPITKGKVVFLGNSITEFGDWQKLLNDSSVLNRGIAGDNTFGVLARLNEIIKREPNKLFLKIGINDIQQNIPYKIILLNIIQIIKTLKLNLPKLSIYLHSILPTNDNVKNQYPAAYNKNEIVNQLNKELEKEAKKLNIFFVDLNKLFRDKSGKLDFKFAAPDGLHLNDLAYKSWIQFLKSKNYL